MDRVKHPCPHPALAALPAPPARAAPIALANSHRSSPRYTSPPRPVHGSGRLATPAPRPCPQLAVFCLPAPSSRGRSALHAPCPTSPHAATAHAARHASSWALSSRHPAQTRTHAAAQGYAMHAPFLTIVMQISTCSTHTHPPFPPMPRRSDAGNRHPANREHPLATGRAPLEQPAARAPPHHLSMSRCRWLRDRRCCRPPLPRPSGNLRPWRCSSRSCSRHPHTSALPISRAFC